MSDFYEEPNWRGEETPEETKLQMSQQAFDLLEQAQVTITRFDINLPMPGDPSKFLRETSIYQGPGHYWYVEGKPDRKFKDDLEAVIYVIEMAEARRHALLNQEFEEQFGGQIEQSK